MDNQRKRSTTTTHSGSDVDNGRKKHRDGVEETTNKSDDQQDELQVYRQEIHQLAESSEKTPKHVVRRVLAHLRTRFPISRKGQARISPLDIVPAEMWCAILDYISDPFDLINCAGASPLFERHLGEKKIQKLFGMALPHLAKYLERKDVLTCRSVCRQWDVGVRRFAERDFLPYPQNENVFSSLEAGNYLQYVTKRSSRPFLNVTYIFPTPYPLLPLIQPRIISESVREEMKQHPVTPFVGGDVIVSPKRPQALDEPGVCPEMKLFLNDFGLHLTSLQIQIDTFTWCDTFTDVCSLVACIFESCPKLRRFEMVNPSQIISHPFYCPGAEIPSLQDHSCIQYIHTSREDCSHILEPLFIKYSNQLIRVDMNYGNAERLCFLPWNSLKELNVDFGTSLNCANVLETLHAPELTHMSMMFDWYQTTFQNFLEVITSFPRLTSLQISLMPFAREGRPSRPSIPEQGILKVPAHVVCRSSITSLEIGYYNDLISFDFLLCFPFIKKLDLVTYSGLILRDIRQQDDWFLRRSDGRKHGELRDSFGGFVHVKEHLQKVIIGGNGNENVCMYRSNIWEILTALKTLTVRIEGTSNRSKMFTRTGYIEGGYDKEQK